MQGAGEGRELSITFQTSGKAVRLSAPEKWRKAVAGQDLRPDSWVETIRQGGSPRTVRADEVPELHALFVELGMAPIAPPTSVVEEADATAEAPAGDAEATPALALAPPLGVTSEGVGGVQGSTRPMGRRDQLGPEGRRVGGGIAAFVIGFVVLANILRGCGHHADHTDLSPLSSQMTIAVDSSAPFQSPPASAEGPAMQAAAAAAAVPESGPPVAAAGPSLDCSRVTSDTLKLVCATPDLAAADRTLATAYQRR